MSEESSPVPTPQRRLSTGGKPPVRVRSTYVVEPAPSRHDPSVPCFTAWERHELWGPPPRGWTVEDFPMADTLPHWSFQIYDTTPGSDSAEHLKKIARALHEDTFESRTIPDRGEPDRFDVWGLPMEEGLGERERVERCREHAIGEAAARMREGVEGWDVPDRRHSWREDRTTKVIVVIDRPREEWGEGEEEEEEGEEETGGCLGVEWDARPDYETYLRGKGERPEVWWSRDTLEGLGNEMREIRFTFPETEDSSEEEDELCE
ncbi:hypothetical protein CkaCkLH20_09640 [Colletotrichum karsti]|uniref:Uncharacterized protein n=1 Tax=Colletotrichum karsti TaxID=1095194 RepID=A0A9P6LHP0_9PEZI|nr:uncharacterized protein CkaCkLH20_09640 [Colletotrichum karsti]KAF9872777.1 hypothetical protein CkaCkLH20_09640 [Colletotrichum karsti]